VGKLDYLFVCVGGGGLLAGSALAAQALSPSCKLVGVEPEAGNDGAQSFEAGRLIKIPVPQTIADGAQTQVLGSLPFEIIRMFVHQFVSVSDQELCRQMKFFVEKMKLVVEPTGCLSAAAVANQKVPLNGKRVGVIVSGGNVDIDRLSQCIQRVS
jgi:threonine dehydratase